MRKASTLSRRFSSTKTIPAAAMPPSSSSVAQERMVHEPELPPGGEEEEEGSPPNNPRRHGPESGESSDTKSYGQVQKNPYEVADRTLDGPTSGSSNPAAKDGPESLEGTDFDLSKRTRPSGEE